MFTRPLWSPGGGGCNRVPTQVSTGTRTRATIKALPASPHLPRPYGDMPLQGRRPQKVACLKFFLVNVEGFDGFRGELKVGISVVSLES